MKSELKSVVSSIAAGQTLAEHLLAWVSASIVLIMMLVTTSDVILRYLFNRPIAGAYELQEFLLVGVVFLSAAYIQAIKKHIIVDVFTVHLPMKTQAVVGFLGNVIFLFIFAIITWQSGLIAWEAWVIKDHTMGLIEYPLWPAKWMLTVGTFALCLRLVSDISRDLHRLMVMFHSQ